MTNIEIKEVIDILKQEGCNSKKQAIEYLERKLKTFKESYKTNRCPSCGQALDWGDDND